MPVTLCAAKEFMPSDDEEYEFDVVWHRSSMKQLLPPPYTIFMGVMELS